MTLGKIIILISFIIGASLFSKTKPVFVQIVLAFLIVSFGISFFQINTLSNISFASLGFLSLIFLGYIGSQKKWLGFVISFAVVVSVLFKSMHWPYGNEIRLLMIIPILCFIWILLKGKDYKKVLSVLTIFVGYAVSELIKLF